jgi:Phage protein Gp138 N-terminal domain
MSQGSDGYYSSRTPGDGANETAEIRFIVQALLGRVRTTIPVRVMAVTNSGGVAPIGRVDVMPLVQQIDGSGSVTSHGTIYDAPYMRIQGGGNAVILDPSVGDIGLLAVCDRDISAVKASAGEAPPGSRRHHDLSDCVYLHSILSAAPTQYVRFSADGIEVKSPSLVRIIAPTTDIVGDLHVSGTITSVGDVVGSGTSLHNHLHGGVLPGAAVTSPPT